MQPRFSQEDRDRQKAKEEEKQRELELSLKKEKRAEFQIALDNNANVLANIFELVLTNHPKVGAKFNIRPGFGNEEEDRLKADVIMGAAMQLTMKHGPLKEQDLNDPACLNNLVVGLIKNMVMNHTLNKQPEIKELLENHQRNLNNLADGLPEQGQDFNDTIALQKFKDGLKNNSPQDVNDALDNLNELTLKNIQKPLKQLFDETEKLTRKVTEQLGESVQRDINNQMQRSFPQMKPTPGAGKGTANGQQNQENADLRENPYSNLTGLLSNIPGSIPINMFSYVGNGLNLITGLRGSSSSSIENVDKGHTRATQVAGQDEGYGGEQEGITQFTKVSADSFAVSQKRSALPNPFSTQLSRDKR